MNISNRFCIPAMLLCFLLAAIYCLTWRDYYVDDAFIGFRCIDNLLKGNGFVFNPGERVESVTNIAWLIAITPFAFFTDIHFAGKIAGILCLLMSSVLLIHIGSTLDSKDTDSPRSGFLRYFVPITALSTPAFVYFSQSGMETAFVCILVGLPVIFKNNTREKTYTAIVYAIATFARPECSMLFPIYLLARSLESLKQGNTAKDLAQSITPSLLLWALMIGLMSLARYSYYGDIVPNTFYAKPSTVSSILARSFLFLTGTLGNLPVPYSGIFLIPICFIGLSEISRRNSQISAICLAGALTGIVFSVYSSNDWTSMPRYMAPYMPYCLFIIFAGLESSELIVNKNNKAFLAIFSFAFFGFMLGNNLINTHKQLGDSSVEEYPGYVLTCKTLYQPVNDMNSILPAEAVVATRRIGLLAYITRRKIFDYAFGLPHSDLASAKKSASINTHDSPLEPFLKDIWQNKQPTHYLEDENKVIDIIADTQNTVDQLEMHGSTFKLLKSYKIGHNEKWLLYQKIGM